MASTATAFVPFSPSNVGADEIEEVIATLESGWLTTGPRVRRFEAEFAAYTGAPHAVAVNSCTAALHLSLLAAGVGQGHEVVTTPLTFCATANVIVHTGATPVFADVDPSTWNLDPWAAADRVTSATRVLLPVDYAGRPAELDAFVQLARAKDLTLIEDAAHCVEGAINGRKVGSIADFTCFSFYATKNLTTGEGGMVTARDEAAAAFIRTASLHGMSRDAWARYAPGAMHARREAISARYDEGLADLPLFRPAPAAAGTVHARHLYPVLVDAALCGVSRDTLQQRMREAGVDTSIHFRAVHLHSYYRDRFGFRRGMFPHAEAVSDSTLSLPLSPAMPDGDVDRVIEALHECLR
jgi:dTDP-4-amino-4,6-dideoxygalactose transaminase